MMMKNQTNIGNEGRSLWQETVRRFRRNKKAVIGMGFLIVLIIIALITFVVDGVTGGAFYTMHVVKQDLVHKLDPPTLAELAGILGYDEFGRSLFWRMIWGIRYSLFIGICSVMISSSIGCVFGAVSGYYGGRLDNLIMRVMDILLSIPYMLMAIAIVSALGPSIPNLLWSISLPKIPSFARICRASVMSVRDREFVEAAKSAGASDQRIILKYIMPNALAPVIVQVTMEAAKAILAIATLSYLGLGVQPPAPEWGSILSSARSYIRDSWHITVVPGMGIMLTILAMNLFGDGLRDALDPKLKR